MLYICLFLLGERSPDIPIISWDFIASFPPKVRGMKQYLQNLTCNATFSHHYPIHQQTENVFASHKFIDSKNI